MDWGGGGLLLSVFIMYFSTMLMFNSSLGVFYFIKTKLCFLSNLWDFFINYLKFFSNI